MWTSIFIAAMPIPPMDPHTIASFAESFAEFPFLKQNGFSFLIDVSGNLFKLKGRVPLKDVEGNTEAWIDYRWISCASCYLCCLCLWFITFLTHLSLSSVRWQAIHAVMLVTKGIGRFSAHLLAASVVKFFENCKLFPRGVTSSMDCITDWSLRMGKALQRLVF